MQPRRSTRIYLLDGPAQGDRTYCWPMPKTIVVAVRNPIRYHDYDREGPGDGDVKYRHSVRCPSCHET